MPDETRRGEENRDFFRESLSDFSFLADIPNVRNRSQTADATKKWRFFLRISAGFRVYPQIYPVCEIRRRTVVVVKSDDFFRESLSDRGKICRYTLCTAVATGTVIACRNEKKRDFFCGSTANFRDCFQIYPVCEPSHSAVIGVKSDDFFENLCRIADFFADIPCVQVMRSGRTPWVVAKKT